MSPEPERFDFVVIGSGPGGQKAAEEAARNGRRALLIEREPQLGGCCVHQGTIPSKTLRETALSFTSLRRKTGDVCQAHIPEDVQVASLMAHLGNVIEAHHEFLSEQIESDGIEHWHGRGRFRSPHLVEVESVDGSRRTVHGDVIVIATGSRPRDPTDIVVDHEHVLDSDSILSLLYLPASLTVLGGGVIASEYASIFASLGVQVTMIDRSPRPLGFLDPELSEGFLRAFENGGGRWIGEQKYRSVAWDGLSSTVVTLESGEEIRSEKTLFTLGREANVRSLHLEEAGVRLTPRGYVDADAHCRTSVEHIYAVGDVIGPPALAASSLEQGRRAVRHALGLDPGRDPDRIPVGIYAIPELSSVGLTQAQAEERYGGALIGRVSFNRIARGQIAAIQDGFLKLVADPAGQYLLGVQILGEGAAELIHLGQMALQSHGKVDVFVENIFNFPTLAEAYRVAALQIVRARAAAPAGV